MKRANIEGRENQDQQHSVLIDILNSHRQRQSMTDPKGLLSNSPQFDFKVYGKQIEKFTPNKR